MEKQQGQTAVDRNEIDLRSDPGVQEIEPVTTITSPETSAYSAEPAVGTESHERNTDDKDKHTLMRTIGMKATTATQALNKGFKNLGTSTKEFLTSAEKKPIRNKVGMMAVATTGIVTGSMYYRSHNK